MAPTTDGSRRRFLSVALAVLAALLGRPASVRASGLRRGPKHPDPRPGITAAKVLADGQVHNPEALPMFAMVREIPEVMDGIRCNCGCAELPGFYSLLSCYEESGMAQACVICQGQAALAYRLHKEGWSLNGIRASIDAKFGESL
ncbi:MAG TPA: PCYCGC motif-containing (lipo)protein [Gemmatimonadales bacterium]|nr:PCYCGC motif-containing (lipo)protein [Gemmatimonadales bacterium]